MKENKNVVVRVTEREERILKYLRINSEKIVEEIKSARYKLGGYETMGDMVALIEDRQIMDLNKLIDNKFITTKDTERLIDAMESNKNIIIVGRSGVGKTTLLNALIEYQKNVVMHVVENRTEVYVPERIKDNKETKTYVTKVNKDVVDMGDISKLVDEEGYKYKRMVINEIIGLDSMIAMSTVVSMGISVLTTTQLNQYRGYNEGGVFEGVSKGIKETLDKHKFVVVEVEVVDGERKVKGIMES